MWYHTLIREKDKETRTCKIKSNQDFCCVQNTFGSITLTLIWPHLYLYRYVLQELIETEKHYVVDLGLIVEVNLTVCLLRTHNLP